MSRNLAITHCRICHGRVVLEEKPRPATVADCGAYLVNYPNDFRVANASCIECSARYLAWVDLPNCGGHWERRPNDEREFVDLSFRSSFSDEPGPDDLPSRQKLLALARVKRITDLEEAKQKIDVARSALRDAELELDDVRNSPIHSSWEVYR